MTTVINTCDAGYNTNIKSIAIPNPTTVGQPPPPPPPLPPVKNIKIKIKIQVGREGGGGYALLLLHSSRWLHTRISKIFGHLSVKGWCFFAGLGC